MPSNKNILEICYLLSLVKSKEEFVLKKNGDKIKFKLELLKSLYSEHLVVISHENRKKLFYNCEDMNKANLVIKSVLNNYYKFTPQILTFDGKYAYDDLVLISGAFCSGIENIEEVWNQFKINKEFQ